MWMAAIRTVKQMNSLLVAVIRAIVTILSNNQPNLRLMRSINGPEVKRK